MSKSINFGYFSEIIEITAKKYNISEKEAELIIRSQFEFIVDELRSRSWCNIKIKHLGKFIVNEGRKIKWWDNKDRQPDYKRVVQFNNTKDRNKTDGNTETSTDKKENL